jgi:hypothetical protein
MRAFRRRLASFALALSALQLALLFAVPVSACCSRKPIAQVSATVEAAKHDCCPAGSHAPGECPLHRNDKSAGQQTSRTEACRMACDTPHAPQIVFAIGVLPAPAVSGLTVVSSPAFTRIVAALASPASFPDGPPPKSL